MKTNHATTRDQRAAARLAAAKAEEDRAIIRAAMSAIGSRSTRAKARAARANGRRGGRPAKEARP